MAHTAIVEVYLRHLLDGRFDTDDLEEVDGRLVLPLPCTPTVRVVPGAEHALRIEVVAAVAHDVLEGPELLASVNDINMGLPYGRVYVVDDVVVVEHTVAGDDLTGDDLDNALRFVTWVVDTFGLALVDDFGGHTHGSMQMALPVTRPDADADDRGDDGEGRVEPGVLVGASAGGYL